MHFHWSPNITPIVQHVLVLLIPPRSMGIGHVTDYWPIFGPFISHTRTRCLYKQFLHNCGNNYPIQTILISWKFAQWNVSNDTNVGPGGWTTMKTTLLPCHYRIKRNSPIIFVNINHPLVFRYRNKTVENCLYTDFIKTCSAEEHHFVHPQVDMIFTNDEDPNSAWHWLYRNIPIWYIWCFYFMGPNVLVLVNFTWPLSQG